MTLQSLSIICYGMLRNPVSGIRNSLSKVIRSGIRYGMLRYPVSRGGQSSVEYTILTVAAVVALIAMFDYVQFALCHRLKTGADGIGQGMLYNLELNESFPK